MTAFNKKTLLTDLHDRTEIIRNNVKFFQQLTPEQLTTKPAPEKWSIAEVFEHLNITQNIYLSSINKAIEHAAINNKDVYKSGWLGNFLYDKIIPRADGTVFKMKTPGALQSKNLNLDGRKVLETFNGQLTEFEHIIEQAKYVDLQKTKIPLSISKFIRLRLGDLMRFMVAHNERHLLQAQRVMTELFPPSVPAPKPDTGRGGSDLVNVH